MICEENEKLFLFKNHRIAYVFHTLVSSKHSIKRGKSQISSKVVKNLESKEVNFSAKKAKLLR